MAGVDFAQQLLNDPYNFDFLALSEDADEREVEVGLVEHIQKLPEELTGTLPTIEEIEAELGLPSD